MKRKDFVQLMIDGREKLWHGKYDDYERVIIKKCERQSIVFITLFTIFAQTTAFTYALEPIIGKLRKFFLIVEKL